MNSFLFSNSVLLSLSGSILRLSGCDVLRLEWIKNTVKCEVLLTFKIAAGQISFVTSELEFKAFEDWMAKNNVQLAPEPEENPPLDLSGGPHRRRTGRADSRPRAVPRQKQAGVPGVLGHRISPWLRGSVLARLPALKSPDLDRNHMV